MRNKAFAMCIALAGVISLTGVYGFAYAAPEPAVKTVLGAPHEEQSGDMELKDVIAGAMPAMVSITCTSVQDVRDYFGGSSDLFDRMFDGPFGFGGFGFGGRDFGNMKQERVSAGSGVIVGETDEAVLIATNAHVVGDADTVTATFIDESSAEAEIAGSDSDEDIALIRVAKKDLDSKTLDAIAVIPIGKSADLALGDGVVVIGNALGYGQSASSGIVSALGRTIEALDESTMEMGEIRNLIQTDAAVNHGNSGGAMLNMRGELVGINVAKGGYFSENIGYAIPIDTAEPVLSGIANGEAAEQEDADAQDSGITPGDGNAFLGVNAVTVTKDYADYYGIPEGAYVQEVVKDSAAERAGIRVGDIITEIDGQAIAGAEELKNTVSRYSDGDTAEVTVCCFSPAANTPLGMGNAGTHRTMTLNVTFGGRPADTEG